VLRTFDPFSREFDRIVERAFNWPSPSWTWATPGMPMDALRREGEVELRFDLPGVAQDSIEVTVDRGVLTVRAQRKQELAEGETPFVRERLAGTFTRRISLGDNVDAEHIEAAYHDGVLTVHVPLAEQARPRKIAITSGERKPLTA
jgi:HSP20 family protein